MNTDQDWEELTNFLMSFKKVVTHKAKNPNAVVQAIQKWTANQSSLTPILCNLIIQDPAIISQGQEEATVDQIVQDKIIKDWEQNIAAEHLTHVCQSLLTDVKSFDLLTLYITILKNREILENNSQDQQKLLESELIKNKQGKLTVANRIYATIFDLEWASQKLSQLQAPVSLSLPQNSDDIKDLQLRDQGLSDRNSMEKPNLRQLAPTFPVNSQDENRSANLTKLGSGFALLSLLAIAIIYPLLLPPTPTPPLIVTPDSNQQSPIIPPKIQPQNLVPQSPISAPPSDLDQFTQGRIYGKNGQWYNMLTEFCKIPKNSTYYDDAKNLLQGWYSWDKVGILRAQNTILKEENQSKSCSISKELASFP